MKDYQASGGMSGIGKKTADAHIESWHHDPYSMEQMGNGSMDYKSVVDSKAAKDKKVATRAKAKCY